MTREQRKRKQVRDLTLGLTNTIKLVGLVFFVVEMLRGGDPYRLTLCVVMMSGIQGLEQGIVVFLERFFGTTSDSK